MGPRWKSLFCITLVLVVALSARAEGDSLGPAFAESVLRREAAGTAEEVRLRRIDKQAFGHAQRFARGENAPNPGPGPDGRVEIVFGAAEIRVFCLLHRLCDIELQEGETEIGGRHTNKSEWSIDYVTAAGRGHIVVEPRAVDSMSSLNVYTDRGRVYRIELIATDDPSKHMPYVSFVYEDDDELKWQAMMGGPKASSAAASGPSAQSPEEYQVQPDRMNFGYEVIKEGRWRIRRQIKWAPVVVFDDGHKTIIRMPESMLERESPILMVKNPDGMSAIVNYRLKGRDFIVDRLFEDALLIKGVGRSREQVRIHRVSEDD